MITPLYAGALAFMLVGLSVNVIRGRRAFGAALGDAANTDMQRRIRAQANLAEYAPLFLILLGYAEYGNLPPWAVHLFGLAFLCGRFMHAYSLLRAEKYEEGKLAANPVWRIRGMMLTFGAIITLAMIIFAQSIPWTELFGK